MNAIKMRLIKPFCTKTITTCMPENLKLRSFHFHWHTGNLFAYFQSFISNKKSQKISKNHLKSFTFVLYFIIETHFSRKFLVYQKKNIYRFLANETKLLCTITPETVLTKTKFQKKKKIKSKKKTEDDMKRARDNTEQTVFEILSGSLQSLKYTGRQMVTPERFICE